MTDDSREMTAEHRVLSLDKAVVERMRAVRKSQQLTCHDLADRLADLGRGDITVNKIWNMQNGRLKPSLDMVFAIANALGVSPLAFLTVPDSEDYSIEVAPGVEISPSRFNAWTTGALPLPGADEAAFEEHQPHGMRPAGFQGTPEERTQRLVSKLATEAVPSDKISATLAAEVDMVASAVERITGEDLPEEQRRAFNALKRDLNQRIIESSA